MRFDYHQHTNYSDGSFMWRMLAAAADAGLEGVGFADHYNVCERERERRLRDWLGFQLDLTAERRSAGIERLRAESDLRVFDAVEMDYDPRDEAAIGRFLDERGFDYAVGSVHLVGERNVFDESQFADHDESERRAFVADYVDAVVSLVESELFDVAAHLDLVERNPALRGLATRADYERIADALADSATVPEVNAGRVLDEYGRFHPREAFLDVLLERGLSFVLGTDAHEPDAVEPRVAELETLVDERDIDVIGLPAVAE